MFNVKRRILFALVVGFLKFAAGTYADDPAKSVIDPAAVDDLVKRLSAVDPVERERASLELERLAPGYLPLVEAAAKRKDLPPEASLRLGRALPRMESRAQAQLKKNARAKAVAVWRTKMTLDYYDRDGHTDPRWDDAARKAITIDSTRYGAETKGVQRRILKEEGELLDKAIAAGCDDPGVLTIKGLESSDTRRAPEEVLSWFKKAKEVTDRHPAVSPFTKQIIDGRLVRDIVARGAQSTADERRAGGLMMGDMVQQYRVAMKMPGIPPAAMIDMANNVLTTAREANKPMNKVFDIVYPPLEAAAPNESETLYIKGFFYVKYAWQARGNGLANTVTPEGWKGFAERLAVANDALTKAWELDPTNPDPPTEMLTVVLGQDGDRDMMEKWFNRAMDANPDNYSACYQKLNYLEPKWHGDAAAMLEFGHQCFDQGNWGSEIPLILAEAHLSLGKASTDPKLYFGQDSVWGDLYACYSKYLELYPDNEGVLNKYCYVACLCGQWTTADTLFKQLGTRVQPATFGGQTKMEEFRRAAAAKQE